MHRASFRWQGFLAWEPILGIPPRDALPRQSCSYKRPSLTFILPCCKYCYFYWKPSIRAKALQFTMAPENIATRIEEVSIDQGEPHQSVQVGRSSEDLLSRLTHEIFKHDCLDRRLEQHHVTGSCTPDQHEDGSLILDRNCFLRCGWHRSFSDLGTDLGVVRSCRYFARIPVRRSYDLRGYAVARRDGQCKTGLGSPYGFPPGIC